MAPLPSLPPLDGLPIGVYFPNGKAAYYLGFKRELENWLTRNPFKSVKGYEYAATLENGTIQYVDGRLPVGNYSEFQLAWESYLKLKPHIFDRAGSTTQPKNYFLAIIIEVRKSTDKSYDRTAGKIFELWWNSVKQLKEYESSESYEMRLGVCTCADLLGFNDIVRADIDKGASQLFKWSGEIHYGMKANEKIDRMYASMIFHVMSDTR